MAGLPNDCNNVLRRSSSSEPPPLQRKRFIDLPPSPGQSQHDLSPLPKAGALPQLPDTNLPIECHDVLRSSRELSTSEHIVWDMRLPWQCAQLRSMQGVVSAVPQHILSSSATLPVSKSMVIICPALPWRISIAADKDVWEAYIAVEEVLQSLEESFSTPVTDAELATICAHDLALLAAIHESRSRRLEDLGDHAASQDDDKVLRIDVLKGESRFAGLRPLANSDHFMLELTSVYAVSLGPKS